MFIPTIRRQDPLWIHIEQVSVPANRIRQLKHCFSILSRDNCCALKSEANGEEAEMRVVAKVLYPETRIMRDPDCLSSFNQLVIRVAGAARLQETGVPLGGLPIDGSRRRSASGSGDERKARKRT